MSAAAAVRLKRTEFMDVEGLGERIREARHRSRQRTTDLASKAGISAQRWFQIESETYVNELPLETFRRMEAALGVDLGVRWGETATQRKGKPAPAATAPVAPPEGEWLTSRQAFELAKQLGFEGSWSTFSRKLNAGDPILQQWGLEPNKGLLINPKNAKSPDRWVRRLEMEA